MSDNLPIDYVIYVRRSSDESSEKQVQSIPRQIEKCIEYTERMGLRLKEKPSDFSQFETDADLAKEDVEPELRNRRIYQESRHLFIVKESKSAKKPGKRPKWKALINLIAKGKINGLISYSPDRQARNMVDGGTLIEFADDGLLDLKYPTFHFDNNAAGRMMLGFWFVQSKQYSDKLSEDIMAGNMHTVTSGKSRGDYKYGYRRREDGYFEPHPEYFPLMQEAFHMKIYMEATDADIAKFLNESGYIREYKNQRLPTPVTARMLNDHWRKSFYYGVYISGNSTVDMREPGMNPYYKPLITEEEHEVLVARYEKKADYAQPKKKKDEYETVTPYVRGTVTTEDGCILTPYLPSPKRKWLKLAKLQETNPDATLDMVVAPHQIYCRCKTKRSKYDGLTITYDHIQTALREMFEHFNITEDLYQEYLTALKETHEKLIKTNKSKLQKIVVRLNNLRSAKQKYMERNMGVATGSEEEEIYRRKKEEFDVKIFSLTDEVTAINDTERAKELEFETFLKLIKKAPQLFEKANYVRQLTIISLFVSNITITDQKQVLIRLKPGLEKCFGDLVKMPGVEPGSESHCTYRLPQ